MFEFVDEAIYRNQIGIYQIRNKKTGCVYVGQTRESFIKRYRYHRWQLRTNSHDNPWLQASFNKHGEEMFEFSVRKVVTDPDELNDLEIKEIELAKQSGKCYNMASGGSGRPGIPLSKEQIKMLAERNRILNTGKKASKETKEKMSEARKGKPRDKSTIEKMIETREKEFLDGKKLKTAKITVEQAKEIKIALMNNEKYEDLAEKYNLTYSNINAIRSNRSWKFAEVDGWNDYIEKNKRNRRSRQSRSAN